MEHREKNIMDLIASAPWREAVAYRETWPHEYVVIQRDEQQELLAEFCSRILRGEGIDGHFFHQTRPYLFLGGYKYWVMNDVEDIDPEIYDSVLNRCPLFRDQRDFDIRSGDTATREETEDMATQPLGQLENVRLRDIWPHEANNFTSWLALSENLKLLGQALGLNLIPIETEAMVGDFSLDLLAKEVSNGELVAIENQLEKTDHSHLGQNITYAAEKGAGYVVWIASRFRAEHRAAVDWLNSLAPEKVRFFAVEIHAIRISGSLPAVEFRPVAVPRGWKGGDIRPSAESPSPTALRHREFFRPLVGELEKAGFGQAEPEQGDTQYWFRHNHKGLWFVVGIEEGQAWVCLWIIGSIGFQQRLYDSLKVQEDEIAVEIGSELEWYEHTPNLYANAALAISGSIDDPPERLNEIRAWMLDMLPRFRDVFNPRLEKILTELEEA